MIALLIFTGARDIMGEFANSQLTHIAAVIGTVVVLLLNIFLIVQIIGVRHRRRNRRSASCGRG